MLVGEVLILPGRRGGEGCRAITGVGLGLCH
jgi:hypothetical protein